MNDENRSLHDLTPEEIKRLRGQTLQRKHRFKRNVRYQTPMEQLPRVVPIEEKKKE